MLREVLGFTVKVAEQKKSQNGYRTRKGTSIHFVSALLLELMQNCAHGVREMLETADVTNGMGMDDDETVASPAAKLVSLPLALALNRPVPIVPLPRTRRSSRHTWTK